MVAFARELAAVDTAFPRFHDEECPLAVHVGLNLTDPEQRSGAQRQGKKTVEKRQVELQG